MEALQKSAIGVAIIATVKEDNAAVNVSSVTTKQLVLKKPDGSTVTKTAAFVTDGTDGKLQYVTISGDLDTAGTWEVQANVVFPSGFNGRSDVQSFEVRDNL